MTLRARLVAALVTLVVLAQGAFVVATYFAYRSSQYHLLDNEMRSSVTLVDAYLDTAAGVANPNGIPSGPHFGPTMPDTSDGAQGGAAATGNADSGGSIPPAFGGFASQGGPGGGYTGPGARIGGLAGASAAFTPGSYAELIGPGGNVIAHGSYETGAARPSLPSNLQSIASGSKILTVGSTSGSTSFRVLVSPAGNGDTSVLATPTTQVTDALDRLLAIEGTAIAALVAVISAGAWLLLRRGLRPLEKMAATAGQISAGDLRQRVDPGDPGSEVGELGTAINTMLDGLEIAFAEREATELRLRQFLADASHELRTPLTSIQGFAELFRLHGEQARVDLPTILRRIEQESARMKVLVEDLLLLARLDQQPTLEARPTNLVVIAADACTDAVAGDPSRPIALDAPGGIEVMGDAAHLRQAVSNLLTNALRHTPGGTPIEVACFRRGTTAILSVRDHGPGLSVEALSHVFDRFWQGDKARVGSGSGLGLSIVAAIAAEHGGGAHAANAPGGGAVFSIILPAIGPPPSSPFGFASPKAVSPGQHPTLSFPAGAPSGPR